MRQGEKIKGREILAQATRTRVFMPVWVFVKHSWMAAPSNFQYENVIASERTRERSNPLFWRGDCFAKNARNDIMKIAGNNFRILILIKFRDIFAALFQKAAQVHLLHPSRDAIYLI